MKKYRNKQIIKYLFISYTGYHHARQLCDKKEHCNLPGKIVFEKKLSAYSMKGIKKKIEELINTLNLNAVAVGARSATGSPTVEKREETITSFAGGEAQHNFFDTLAVCS